MCVRVLQNYIVLCVLHLYPVYKYILIYEERERERESGKGRKSGLEERESERERERERDKGEIQQDSNITPEGSFEL